MQGLGTHFVATNQALGTEPGAVGALMVQPDGPSAWASLKGSEENREVALREF